MNVGEYNYDEFPILRVRAWLIMTLNNLLSFVALTKACLLPIFHNPSSDNYLHKLVRYLNPYIPLSL